MSWLFSQALVAEYSAATFSAGEPSPPSSGTPTQQAYCSPDKMTEFSRLSRFGMTFRPLTADHSEALLTSYLAASRARTSAQPAQGKASKGHAAACGSTWHVLSMRYDPTSSTWKTAHCLWEEDLPWSSVTLPRWGMTRNGLVFQHLTAERPISGIVSGLWATPSATDGNRGGVITSSMTGISLAQQIKTPTRWPTPKANDAEKRGNFDTTNPRNGLPAAVKAWPTPTRRDHKGGALWNTRTRDGKARPAVDQTLPDRVLSTDGRGQLNPTWVEWLMGWPLGWTDLKPLAMDRFREWQQQHSPCSNPHKEAA